MIPTKLTPAEFAVLELGMVSAYPWQLEALEAIGWQEHGGKPVSVVAANGSGKTAAIVAPAILWFLRKYPHGQVVCTSGSFRQVEKQLWPAMRRFSAQFPEWRFLTTEIKTPEGGFALGFSTDDAGRAEGWHPKISREVDPVFIIVDEAKTVGDPIFEAFDRCTRNIQLWVSSPGAPRGQFYDSHHSTASHFYNVKVPSSACPHISAEKRERDLRTYGENHPVYRSMHLAEFTEDEDRMVLTAGQLAASLSGQPEKNEQGEVVAFCDFAAGGDENVIAVRRGNHASVVKAWHEKNTMQAAREFVRVLQQSGIPPHQTWGDADGLGTVMLDAMAELGYRANRFHGGAAATNPDEYANLIGETWLVGAREIERGRVHLGELDPITSRQLTSRKSEWNDKGKLRVESKEKMRTAGIKSPDRADALLGCIFCGQRLTDGISAEQIEDAWVPDSPFSSDFVVL